jgi:hypothetical protein
MTKTSSNSTSNELVAYEFALKIQLKLMIVKFVCIETCCFPHFNCINHITYELHTSIYSIQLAIQQIGAVKKKPLEEKLIYLFECRVMSISFPQSLSVSWSANEGKKNVY